MSPEIEQAIIDTIGQVQPVLIESLMNNLSKILLVAGIFIAIIVLVNFLREGVKGR
jgi:hypothetical protein